jgi:PAS domain S-box-containing protein
VEERIGREAWRRYGVAILLVALATLLTIVIQPWLSAIALAPYYIAVALVAWYGGLGPALFTIGLSLIAINLWALLPSGEWTPTWTDLNLLITFLVVSALITALSASRDRAEDALRASERRFRAMLETANEGVWLIDREARTQYVNDRMASLLGTTPEEIASRPVTDFVFPDDIASARARIDANLAGRSEEFDFRFRRADGKEVLVLAGTSPVRGSGGRIAGALGLYTDITDRRRAEADLAHANERFSLAADAVQALIYEWDLTTGRVERSSGLFGLLGYRPGEDRPDQAWWHDHIHPDDQQRIDAETVTLDADDDRYSRQYLMRHRDGYWVMVWDQGRLVRDAQGQVVRIVGSVVDVSARTEAEDALRLLDEAGRALASSLDYEETLQRVAWVAVPALADWCVVDLLNERGEVRRVAVAHADPAQAELATRLMQRPLSEGSNGTVAQVIRSGVPVLVEELTDELMDGNSRGEEDLALLRAIAPTSAIIVPLRAGGTVHGTMSFSTSAFTGNRFDADDLALAEQIGRRVAVAIQNALLYRNAQEAEARYRGLFEGTIDGIMVFAPNGACVDVNPAMAAMVGYSRDELIGAQATLIAPSELWEREVRERLRLEGQWRGEFELRRKDGSGVPVESWFTRTTLPIGPVFVGVLRDVSERRRLERIQEEFLSTVAHDLKNPLTTVRGQSQLLQRRLERGEPPDAERLRAGLEGIDTATGQMVKLLDELVDVMRLRGGREIELRREPTDLVALARRASEAHDRGTERHSIQVHADAEELVGFWDGNRLERVLGNLLGNAIKYSPEGGEIVIRISRQRSGDAAHAVVSVEDHGVGIPASDLGLVFERYQRAGNVESIAGSGIGLAGAKRIVELHGGTISVASVEGVGSTFTVRLPIAEPPMNGAAADR